MKKLAKRSHKRRQLKTPVTHSMYNTNDHSKLFPIAYYDNHHEGMSGNISAGGMYFESDIPCWEKGPVHVNLRDGSKGMNLSATTETISGKVVWCRENAKSGPQFRIGVKFDEQLSNDIYTKEFGALWLS